MFLRICRPCHAVAIALVLARAAAAQTPAQTTDAPSIKVGATIYTDFTDQTSPQSTDADGNAIESNAFNVSRSYINITGSLSHIVAFRITPDVVRESGLVTAGPGGAIANDSLVFRIKYAFMQFNLDDWLTKGSWVRLGIQQTPLLDYEEGIYRYRFQGTTFTEREGFYNSADAGVSFHYNLPSDFGEVHAGLYNGDGYTKPDSNDQKAVEVRGTLRPFARGARLLHGLRVTAFYVGDHYIRNDERMRAVGQATFESQYVNAGVDAIVAHDQPSAAKTDVRSSGWSFWATPRKPLANGASLELLLRYDHLNPDDRVAGQARPRTIGGVAYWFPHQGSVSSAVLVDYDGQTFDNFAAPQAAQRKIAVHGLINF